MTATGQSPPETRATNGGSAIDASRPAPSSQTTAPDSPLVRHIWAVTRISMGWIFLWPFMDKLFGLGYSTPSARSWLNGGNPTEGFLSGASGPFAGIYHDIAGAGLVNVLFMGGLLAIGIALLLGIAMWPACIAGATMVLLMWTAALPPETNPFMDDHIIYAMLLIGLAATGAGTTLGLGDRWNRLDLVQRHRWLA
jgi:thiosulfate dehydrogenase (quinone) large subunit